MTEDNREFMNPPHIRQGDSIAGMMWTVALALLPAAAWSVHLFGHRALLLLAAGVLSAVASEALTQLALSRRFTAHDGSAAVTGLLVALNVPPEAPLWMAGAASGFAIIVMKQAFGGLGRNIFNPALSARALVMILWPLVMAAGWRSFSGMNFFAENTAALDLPPAFHDIIGNYSPLAVLREGPRLMAEYGLSADRFNSVFIQPQTLKFRLLGITSGAMGETSILMLSAGALILLARRIITWHIPVAFIGSLGALACVYYRTMGYSDPWMPVMWHLRSGGLFLSAFFMATDGVTTPITRGGMLLFGMGCGALTFAIRILSGRPEFGCFSILLMNAAVPLIDRYVKPRVFGR
jgi:electron transport complex protein RnfD